jgi:hypothetical protein
LSDIIEVHRLCGSTSGRPEIQISDNLRLEGGSEEIRRSRDNNL